MNNENKRVAADSLVRESLDHMGQGVTIFDGDLKLVSWNHRFLDLLSFPAELAFEGADFESFIRHNALSGEYGPGDVDAQVAERVEQARAFEPHDFERESKNGKTLRVVGSPLPSGGFVTVYTDITAEKNRKKDLELKVEERTTQLRLSESRLQLIADEVPAGIAHIDRDMNILFVNKRFARAYGREPSQMIGKPCKKILHHQTLERSSRFFEQARRGKMVDFEMEITLPNGLRREIRTYLRPEHPSDGEVIGFYLLSLDVTRLKIANSALLQSQKMDALGRMSSGISHDFNNVLAIILGNLVPLTERLDDKEILEEYLDPAIAAARRGSDLTRRLLSLAKSEPVHPSAVDVGALISGMIELLQSTFPRDIDIVFSDKTSSRTAMVDPAQLEMALLNLFMNARDAIGSQGCLTIEIKPEELGPSEAQLNKLPVGSYIKIRVTDDGGGITKEAQERIFEPFYTSKGSSGGTGLGLSMVFGFVRESNGTISVASEPGVGTTFSILLPVAESEATGARDLSAPDSEEPADGPENPLVLLVEDDEGVRTVVRRHLIALGYPLIEAEDAAVALELFRSIPEIELMLSDISMPGEMDGIALAECLSREEPGLGIVLMSGQRASLSDLGKANTYPFLAKPFEKSDLANVLSSVQKNRELKNGPEMQ
ncbi:PAS-domain containing protein [Primorskyibacter aestuariivivens]|uniref:PAS-domain containing protein n=1 Tax=Primorskyibacter aestuariivivens TaxID=1888912 RepID=UPI0023002356|nr:PAS-domain containing protein [Primorskyibacter aestuariivivens]MDA7429095.1 PAS-domain containing protein [Primorskyibacter aestuariivivens]